MNNFIPTPVPSYHAYYHPSRCLPAHATRASWCCLLGVAGLPQDDLVEGGLHLKRCWYSSVRAAAPLHSAAFLGQSFLLSRRSILQRPHSLLLVVKEYPLARPNDEPSQLHPAIVSKAFVAKR
jgi:hypothetical protein